MKALALTALAAAACNSAGSARYRSSAPPRLADAATPAPEVRLTFAPFTWAGTAGDRSSFRVMVSTEGGDAASAGGARLGELRTVDRELDAIDRAALYCLWGPGQHDDCVGQDGDDVRSRDLVASTVRALRDEAARVGADQVRGVRCYVHDAALWCEGAAYDGPLDFRPALGEPVLVAHPGAAPSRWKVNGTFTAGRYGARVVTGTTMGLSYRGVEAAFHMVSTPDWSAIGLGGDLLYRHAIKDQLSGLGGVTAMLLAPLSREPEATPGRSRGALGAVLGLRYVAKDFALFDGFGKPFAELRLGWLGAKYGGSDDGLAGLNVEALVGMTTP